MNKGYAVSEFEVDVFLDSILSFCDDDRMLSLFKQVCRLSYRLYPQMITEYVELYKNLYLNEMWCYTKKLVWKYVTNVKWINVFNTRACVDIFE